MSKQLIEVIRILTDENELLKRQAESMKAATAVICERNANQAKTIHALNKACFRMRRRLKNIQEGAAKQAQPGQKQ